MSLIDGSFSEKENSLDVDSIINDYLYDQENLVEIVDENFLTLNKSRASNLRKAASLSTCALCDANNPNISQNSDGGFALRQVVSCSICTWELDDRCFEDNFKAISSGDEEIEQPTLKRLNSYTRAMSESSYVLDSDEDVKTGKELNNNDIELERERPL